MLHFRHMVVSVTLCLLAPALHAQGVDGTVPAPSPHAAQARLRPQPPSPPASVPHVSLRRPAATLTHVVHGYHPYWIADAAADGYRWDLLSHLAYFSYEVDPANGEAATIRNWLGSAVIDRAKAEGVQVLLTVTNFGAANNRTLLSSEAARDTLIARLVGLLAERGGHGVNLDFESVPGDMREALVLFAADLRRALDAARDAGHIPGAVISVAAPAVDWNGGWDVAALSAPVDLFFVMCYDYSWSASANAGPVAPIRGMSYNVERSLRWYLDQGVPAAKLLMGVPYYGYDWPVIDGNAGAATTGRATARTYATVRQSLGGWTRQWSETFLNPWVAYEASSWRQLWYDDEESIDHKYDLVHELGIGGTGMWALGYDQGYDALWSKIEQHFTRPAHVEAPGVPASPAIWPRPLRAGQAAFFRGDGVSTDIRVSVHDLLGRRVATLRADGGEHGLRRFTVPSLPPGSYLLMGADLRAVIQIIR